MCTIGKKGCCTYIWGNEIDMDPIFVLPVGWNWHEMYLWLLPNEIRPYLDRTFTSMSSGIVEVQNRSLSDHFPKSTFALWQVRINNCILFSILTDCSNNAPSTPYIYWAWSACTCQWDLCYRQPHPPEACCHWNFGTRLLGRPHLVKTVHYWGWSNRIASGRTVPLPKPPQSSHRYLGAVDHPKNPPHPVTLQARSYRAYQATQTLLFSSSLILLRCVAEIKFAQNLRWLGNWH